MGCTELRYFAIIPRRPLVATVAEGPTELKSPHVHAFTPQPALLPCRVPTVRKTPKLENPQRRDVPAAGAVAASHIILGTAAHGLFRPATDQRHCARLDLRPDRHRLHHGLWHRRHDQFSPWRPL